MLVSAIHHHESAIGIRMPPPSWTSFPPPTPSDPSRLSPSSGLSALHHTADSHYLAVLHVVYMFQSSSILFTLSFPLLCAQLFSLCFSLLLPCKLVHQYRFSRFHIYVNMLHLCFSFWLTSLCIAGSRFIHLTRTDSNSFFFMANIPLFICTQLLNLFIHIKFLNWKWLRKGCRKFYVFPISPFNWDWMA